MEFQQVRHSLRSVLRAASFIGGHTRAGSEAQTALLFTGLVLVVLGMIATVLVAAFRI